MGKTRSARGHSSKGFGVKRTSRWGGRKRAWRRVWWPHRVDDPIYWTGKTVANHLTARLFWCCLCFLNSKTRIVELEKHLAFCTVSSKHPSWLLTTGLCKFSLSFFFFFPFGFFTNLTYLTFAFYFYPHLRISLHWFF